MPAITVRPATESDIPALTILMNELGYLTSTEEMKARYDNILRQTDYKTVVAVREGEVLGMAGFLKIHYWECNGHFIRVQALVVRSTTRRLGVGRLLLQSVEEWGVETGAVLISLNCGNKESRKDAHRFYPKVGFEHTSSGYTKWLQD